MLSVFMILQNKPIREHFSIYLPSDKIRRSHISQYVVNLRKTLELAKEWFYEDLQDLPELTPKKDVLFIIGD